MNVYEHWWAVSKYSIANVEKFQGSRSRLQLEMVFITFDEKSWVKLHFLVFFYRNKSACIV